MVKIIQLPSGGKFYETPWGIKVSREVALSAALQNGT